MHESNEYLLVVEWNGPNIHLTLMTTYAVRVPRVGIWDLMERRRPVDGTWGILLYTYSSIIK